MEPRHTTSYFANGLRLSIILGDDALVDAVDQTVRYHGFRPAVDGSDATDLEITIRSGTPLETVPERAELVRTHPAGIRMHRTSERLYLSRDAAVMAIEATTGKATMTLPLDAANASADVNSTLYLLLTFGLVLLLQTRDLFVLHAAALASPGDRGFLIVAPSGSGKSTLSMRLVESGWKFVSDDSVVLGQSDGEVVVRPFRRDAAIFVDAVSEYPRAAEFNAPLFSDPSKVLVDMNRAYPDQRLESVVPSVTVFPEISGRPETRVEVMDPAEAMVALIGQGSFLTADREFVSRQMNVFQRLIGGTKLLKLHAGLDLRDDPAAANRILTQVDSNPHSSPQTR